MPSPAEPLVFTIGATERETGLSKDVLRVWERRYGFPRPARDPNGERVYAATDVAKLRTIRRLMETGVRPGKVIHLEHAALHAMAHAREPSRRDAAPSAVEHDVVALLKRHDVPAIATLLGTLLVRQGLAHFVRETLVPIDHAVGEAVMRGDVRAFEEQVYVEQAVVALRAALHAFPRHAGTPRMLVAALPGERPGLGPLLLEALLVPAGAQCISLGGATPLEDIGAAASAFSADVVAVPFASRAAPRQAAEGLASLRRALPAHVALWGAGPPLRRLRKTVPGATLLPDLAGVVTALRSHRVQHDAPPT